MNEALKTELIAMAQRDQDLLQALKDSGELPENAYHPALKALHEANTSRAREIIRDNGWPAISEVGEDASEAMWLIVQHSIEDPEFMLSCVARLRRLVDTNEAKGWQLAFLEDRALMLQDKPQVYGTQHVLDSAGELQPYAIAEPEDVDHRRAALGLEPLAERTAFLRADHEKVRQARAARVQND